MGILASRGLEYEDSYRSFSEKERQLLSSLFDKLATANEHGVMKIELGPFKVSSNFGSNFVPKISFVYQSRCYVRSISLQRTSYTNFRVENLFKKEGNVQKFVNAIILLLQYIRCHIYCCQASFFTPSRPAAFHRLAYISGQSLSFPVKHQYEFYFVYTQVFCDRDSLVIIISLHGRFLTQEDSVFWK